MSGIIDRLNNAFRNEPDHPPVPKTITMEDIAKVTTGSITARALNTVKLAAEGKFVTSSAVRDFLGSHGMDKLKEVSDIFTQHAQINGVSSLTADETRKQIKQERKDLLALSKVFDKAASELLKTAQKEATPYLAHFQDHQEKLQDFKQSLSKSQDITNGMKTLEQYRNDPSLLLRASLFNKEQQPIQKDFITFLQTYKGKLNDEGDLKTAYSSFVHDKKSHAEKYMKDDSTFEYQNTLLLVKNNMLNDKSATDISKMKVKDLVESLVTKEEPSKPIASNKDFLDDLFGDSKAKPMNKININEAVSKAEANSKISAPLSPGGSLKLDDFKDAENYIKKFKGNAEADKATKTEENQKFLDALTALNNIAPDQRGTEIDKIMKTFILNGGDYQININYQMRTALEQKWTKEP